MKVLTGQGASKGIALGKIFYYHRRVQNIEKQAVSDTDREIKRAEQARDTAVTQLGQLYQKTLDELGEKEAELFQIHQMMLEDLDYWDSITGIIKEQKVNAEYAVSQTAKTFSAMFTQMTDPYMQARAADVGDISGRLIDVLQGNTASTIQSATPVIVAADDLAPSETVQLDKTKILAFVTAGGSENSHTSILARTMGIPAVIALGDSLTDACDGLEAIVDGDKGLVYLDPDAATSAQMRGDYERQQRERQALEELKGLPNRTVDGKDILVYANIGSPADMDAVLNNDAGGIGLFRSEFLYLENNDYPTEEQQYHAYKTVAEKMAGKQVIIRTLDIGADKQAAYFHLPKEENPALGLRAIRICLTQPAVFVTQLRAIYRASAHGNVAIMFPMIASVWEVRKAKEIAAQVREQLQKEKIPFSPDVQIGIMIETPAAAILSDQLAKEVDFFSIGTNDLTQYTLAADRQNQRIHEFVDTHHPAVLRLIQQVAANARQAGIPVGICGELGADLALTGFFLKTGIDELSVSPSAILPLRKKVRETDTATVELNDLL